MGKRCLMICSASDSQNVFINNAIMRLYARALGTTVNFIMQLAKPVKTTV